MRDPRRGLECRSDKLTARSVSPARISNPNRDLPSPGHRGACTACSRRISRWVRLRYFDRPRFRSFAQCCRCAPWRAKRRRVVLGRRWRERVAAVAKGRKSRSRGGNMQSASHTPSSHLRALSCPADQREVGHGCDRRANPGTKGRRQGPSTRGSRMPPRSITRDTRLSGVRRHGLDHPFAHTRHQMRSQAILA